MNLQRTTGQLAIDRSHSPREIAVQKRCRDVQARQPMVKVLDRSNERPKRLNAWGRT